MDPSPPAPPPRPHGVFPTTRWTLILSSRDDAEVRRKTLDTLLAAYWKPVYFYLRRKGLDVEAAEDVVQGLFLQLFERDFLARLDPARGRLRSYLRTAADHYLANVYARDATLKRGGAYRLVPLDTVLAERDLPGAGETAEAAYEKEWAIGVMERALERLQQEYAQGRRRGRSATVLRFFGLGEAPSYAEAAADCGLTIPQFKASLHRARVRFREILREEVAPTVADDREADAEMQDLRRVLGA